MSPRSPELEYGMRLDAILSKPLSPEIINAYADIALGQVVDLVEDYTSDYLAQTELHFGSKAGAETAATVHWGLRDIEEVLDHLSETTNRINLLALAVGRAVCRPDVIVPSDVAVHLEKTNGTASFETKKMVDKLKTTLFILQNDFDVDIHNTEELQLVTGVVTDNMMRKESYYGIIIPKLERTILVCDEEGNVSYIFNTAKLLDHGLNDEHIFESTKQELNELLNMHNELGQRMLYSKYFVERMRRAIEQPVKELTPLGKIQPRSSSSYLYPKATEDILSAAGISNETGLPYHLVQRSISSLGDLLGQTSIYKFGPNNVTGYSPEQQRMIVASLLEQKSSAIPNAPEGYMSLSKLAKEVGTSTRSVNQAISELGESIGELELFMFFSKEARGCSPEQQQMIRVKLSEPRKRMPSGIPQGYLSATSLAANINVDRHKVQRVVAELGEALIQLPAGAFKPKRQYYSPEQQQMIIDKLTELEKAMPAAPGGIMSVRGMCQKFGVHDKTMRLAINEIGDKLGDAKTYMFSRPVTGYTHEQQIILEDYLTTKGVLVPVATPGVSSFNAFQAANHIARATLLKEIDDLGQSLGDIRRYRFGSKKHPAVGLSAEQQEMIIASLKKK